MHTKLPWDTLRDNEDCIYIFTVNGQFSIAELTDNPGFGEDGRFASDLANAKFICKAVNNHDEIVSTLELIKRGLESGNIKAKPIIDFSVDAPSLEMKSLSEIIGAILAKVQS